MLRAWDRATAAHVHEFIANSNHVAGLIGHAYGKPATVVHPPARLGYFTPGEGPRGAHWLAVGALEPYKRFDIAIGAARLAGATLRIVGDGTMRAALERDAPPNVIFLGRLGDGALRHEMRTAAVLLVPQVEDFGITTVEAQACGLPVAARGLGGSLDIVRDGLTGVLCDGSPEALAQAATRATTCDPAACVANAQRFGESAFEAAVGAALERWIRRTVRPSPERERGVSSGA